VGLYGEKGAKVKRERVLIQAQNFVSIEEARRFAAYCRGRGFNVDLRESEKGIILRTDAEWDIYEKLQCDFYQGKERVLPGGNNKLSLDK